MLPKKEKFTSKDFSDKNIFKNSKKTYTKYGFFVVLEGENKKGIILSKKVFKTAVLRNKYKRLFYNSILELQKSFPQINTKSFVFHPKKEFSKEDLLKDLKSL